MSNKKDMISRLKKRIDIEEASYSSDGGGGATTTWTKVTSVWAEIIPYKGIKSSESFKYAKVEQVGRYKITIRYLDGIDTTMRIKLDTRYFNIRSVIDPDETQELLEIYGEEGVAI